MDHHVMPAETAVELLDALRTGGADVCVGGGWAVDALLGEQTREHSDLDLWVPADDFEHLIVVLAGRGIDRLFPVPGDRPWNFVVHDGGSLRVDLHVYEPLADGTLHYGRFVDGHTFPGAAVGGQGVIGARTVRCDAAEWAVRWHTGYPPRRVDFHDVRLLCARFGLDLPEIYSRGPDPRSTM